MNIHRLCIAVLLSICLSACETLFLERQSNDQEALTVIEPAPVIEPSSEPINDAKMGDILFAQTALKTLNYKIGQVDGIWGPRSATAMRAFETDHELLSADGFLSELNLTRLAERAELDRDSFAELSPTPIARGIAALLDKDAPLSDAPQLVILDRDYTMLSKPNPFSEQLSQLAGGAGIYVINLRDGWYEVETKDKQRGFIKAE